jgi:protein-S-isoprenylcysteine O-methyltransferase Ste14
VNMHGKEQESRGNPIRLLMRVPVPWVFILAYLVGVGLEFAYPSHTGKKPLHAVSLAGGVLFIIGAAIAAWSLVLFFRVRTTTVPGRISRNLVMRGPYRFSRNLMYVGLVVAYLGEAGILKQARPILFLPLTVAYLNWIVIPVEEARLTEAFGTVYEQYRARVRRWI